MKSIAWFIFEKLMEAVFFGMFMVFGVILLTIYIPVAFMVLVFERICDYIDWIKYTGLGGG